jgi:L-iditol 2-dehydrogenase
MWAHVLDGPMRFKTIEVPDPLNAPLAEGDVILRFLAGGICGSDLPAFRGQRRLIDTGPAGAATVGAPMHEVAGEVVRSGDPALAAGSIVVGWADKANGLTEYVVTKSTSVRAFSGDHDPAVAILLQPLACVLSAADRLPDIAGKRVAVIGQGPIGALFAHVLKSLGAGHVTGVDRIDRTGGGAQFGTDEFARMSSDQWAAGLAPGERPYLVVEAVGHQVATVTDAVNAVAPFGHVYCFGIPDEAVYPFPMNQFLRKHLTMQSGVTIERPTWLAAADAYLEKHPDLAETYVTGVFGADNPQAAFEAAINPRPGQVKLTLSAS